MEVYRGKNGRALLCKKGVVESHDVYEYLNDSKTLISKFKLEGDPTLFIFEPSCENLSGSVRVHYELSASGASARVTCIEFLDTELKILGKFFKEGYSLR